MNHWTRSDRVVAYVRLLRRPLGQSGRTTLGGKLGEATHQIALIELPTHQPAGTFTSAGTATGGLGAGSTVFLTHTAGTPQVTGTFTGTTQGADGGHNNAQPTHMVNKIIFTGVA